MSTTFVEINDPTDGRTADELGIEATPAIVDASREAPNGIITVVPTNPTMTDIYPGDSDQVMTCDGWEPLPEEAQAFGLQAEHAVQVWVGGDL